MAYQTINPYTGKTVKTYDSISDSDLETALTSAHALYKKWKASDALTERISQLRRLAAVLRRNEEQYARIITGEVGKIISESRGEVELSASIAEYYADHGEEFMAPVPVPTASGRAYYLKQSTGVIFAVEPWNFPFYQVMRVFAPNFIAGNTMLLKHASICPSSAQAFEDAVKEAGIEEGAFKNLFISYDQVSKAIADPRISGVCLTGSERGGASVASEAGKVLKKSSMELGGNDAFIILDDADMDVVKRMIAPARLYNAGQVCASSKRFIVTEKNYDRFVSDLIDVFSQVKLGDPMDENTTMGPLSSAQAKKDVLDAIDAGIRAGAQVLYGNKPVNHPGNFVMPTILTGITRDNPLYNKEVFGPVGEVFKVRDEEEAIALANDSSYGLGSTVFSRDLDRAQAAARRIEAGMTIINAPCLTQPDLPFGGVKNSGYGRELAELGFYTFLNEHMVYVPEAK